MSWNYRIIQHADGRLELHEVYYDQAGRPVGFTERGASFGTDLGGSVSEIVGPLELALNDARNRPVLKESDFEQRTTASS
jgi:YD repeat-containing protein